jgi:hypothetical protein
MVAQRQIWRSAMTINRAGDKVALQNPILSCLHPIFAKFLVRLISMAVCVSSLICTILYFDMRRLVWNRRETDISSLLHMKLFILSMINWINCWSVVIIDPSNVIGCQCHPASNGTDGNARFCRRPVEKGCTPSGLRRQCRFIYGFDITRHIYDTLRRKFHDHAIKSNRFRILIFNCQYSNI